MELEQNATVEKRVTVEVNTSTRRIIQVRGKLNRYPNAQELSILRRWANDAKLVLNQA
jgi:hypothetical protein